MNEAKNRNADYTVFRAYRYWIVNSKLVENCSVILSDISIVCGVNKVSINQVLKIAKEKIHNKTVKYEPFITVKWG